MTLTVVGCSGAVPGPHGAASCYLVQAAHDGGTFSLLLDLGPGAFGALQTHLNPARVEAVAFSHLHQDHCLDMCAYYNASGCGTTAPGVHTTVFGPAGTRERLDRACEVNPGADPVVRGTFTYRDWQPEQRIGPFLLRTVAVVHPVPAYAIRVEHHSGRGGALVYSGDTGPCPPLVELARDADLLLIEAALSKDSPHNPHHLTGAQAAAIAQAAQARKVVLTHIPPWHDADAVLTQARAHFDGPLELAAPAAQWRIG